MFSSTENKILRQGRGFQQLRTLHTFLSRDSDLGSFTPSREHFDTNDTSPSTSLNLICSLERRRECRFSPIVNISTLVIGLAIKIQSSFESSGSTKFLNSSPRPLACNLLSERPFIVFTVANEFSTNYQKLVSVSRCSKFIIDQRVSSNFSRIAIIKHYVLIPLNSFLTDIMNTCKSPLGPVTFSINSRRS